MRRIKKDDMVRIITGKDKGKEGKVLSFDPKTNKVVVEGCNMVTKHQKPSQANPAGRTLEEGSCTGCLQRYACSRRTGNQSRIQG